jgi:hypothetical protein
MIILLDLYGCTTVFQIVIFVLLLYVAMLQEREKKAMLHEWGTRVLVGGDGGERKSV